MMMGHGRLAVHYIWSVGLLYDWYTVTLCTMMMGHGRLAVHYIWSVYQRHITNNGVAV